MAPNDSTNQKYSRRLLIELLVTCPLGGNSRNCPLYEKRKLTMKGRINWVDSLSDEECRKICLAHCECLQKKVRRLG